MAERINILKSIVWDIEPGSLVKVKRHTFNGQTYYEHGIVIGKKEINQIEMFPSVEVYTFETQIVSRQSPSSIEVISRPSDEEDKTNLD